MSHPRNVRSVEERLIDAALRETKQPLSVVGAKDLFRTLLFTIANTVRRGSKVEVPGFGVFYRAQSKARDICHPVTGARMRLPRTRRLGFRAAGAQKWSDA